MTKKKSKIGFWTTTALVVGNMIGSGVFLTPAALAAYGPISIIGWIFSGFCALSLAFVFSRLSSKLPIAHGGPYAFTRIGLGDFAGFLVAWGYWISVWCANAAIIVALVSYLGYFFPILNSDPLVAVILGLIILWVVTYINTRGIKEAGFFQLITTILKITPLFLVGFCGLFYIDLANFTPLNISGKSDLSAITAVAAFTLFSFLGVESATVPSNSIENPGRVIPRATYLGLGITFLVYFLGSTAIMGMIPASELVNSPFPYSDAAAIMWGPLGGTLVTLGAVFSTLGALNGWILIQGQIPSAIAADALFPKVFAKMNRHGVPATGLIISCVFVSVMMMMNYTDGLVKTYSFFILLSTFLALVPYLFSVAAYGILLMQDRGKGYPYLPMIGCSMAFIFTLWAVIGSGQESVFYGFIILMAGIPMYIFMKTSNAK
ncbi:MAG: amino acid permease [Flammeovirgaceae bacterium]|jgi:basic amino acid/polyamine antiporter, APA family|nr:amino acid permease [Flammeovirgaceae bacterium]|tara:strand:- start:792 stop:2093 length:1302 start_codon:yes stop_codon:yes gene_type:complete